MNYDNLWSKTQRLLETMTCTCHVTYMAYGTHCNECPWRGRHKELLELWALFNRSMRGKIVRATRNSKRVELSTKLANAIMKVLEQEGS